MKTIIKLSVVLLFVSCSPRLELVRYDNNIAGNVELTFRNERQTERAYKQLRDAGAYCERSVYGTIIVSRHDKPLWIRYIKK